MLLRGRYTVGELAEACGIPSHMASDVFADQEVQRRADLKVQRS
jgi:hypothetical protein